MVLHGLATRQEPADVSPVLLLSGFPLGNWVFSITTTSLSRPAGCLDSGFRGRTRCGLIY